jgi:hypothetical protein
MDQKSRNTGQGGGGDLAKALFIKSRSADDARLSDTRPTTCRFVSQTDDEVTVSVLYSSGGISNGTLRHNGDDWELHVAAGDSYCWKLGGPCVPDGSTPCSPGNTYYVG